MELIKYSVHPLVVPIEEIRRNDRFYASKYAKDFQTYETSFSELPNHVLKHVWSSQLFAGGVRLRENFAGSFCFALDIDSPEYPLERALKDWCDSVHIIATTKNHQVAKGDQPPCDRYRIISLWDRPIVDLEEYEYNISLLIEKYGADTCKDGARFFYQCRDVVSTNFEGYRQKVVSFSKPQKVYQQGSAESGERNNFLISVGGKLRRDGRSKQQIISALKKINDERVSPPVDDRELSEIIKSTFRFEGQDHIDDVKADKPAAKISPQVVHYANEQVLQTCFSMTTGLVREIANTILNHSVRPYENFAMAAALQIISGVSQGAIDLPSLADPTQSGGSLCLYQWLSAQSAAGKESYLRAVHLYLAEIDRRLICPNLGSNLGLRMALYAMNSVVSVTDEMQDEMERLSGPKASMHLNQVLTDMKILTGAPRYLNTHAVKGAIYPTIENPRYSMFGVGTLDGLMRQLKGDLIKGGLLSRFTVWLPFKVRRKRLTPPLKRIPLNQIDSLRKIFEYGLTEHGKNQDYLTAIKEFNQCAEGKANIPHKMQTEPGKKILGISDDARQIMSVFTRKQEDLYIKYTSEDLSGSDISPGSVADRAPFAAFRFAGLHAVGRGSWTIETLDVEFGIALAKCLSDSLCELVTGYAGDSEVEKLENQIMRVMAKANQPIKKRDIVHSMTVRDLQLFNRCLLNLWMAGKLSVFNSRGDPVSPDDQKEIPRGALIGGGKQ